MKKKRMHTMFAPFLSTSKISKNLLFFGVFVLLGFSGNGQDLSIENITEDEDVGNMVFTVTLDGNEPLGTSVTYFFIDLSTTGGIDYDNTVGPALNFIGFDGETQIITVSITDDLIDENNNEDFTIQLDTPTNGVALSDGGDARGRIRDNDTAGVNVSTTTGTTTEAGGQATFTFTLTSEPTADVTILIDQYNVTETSGPATIVLTPTNWNIGVPLIVTGVDDDIVDGDIVDEIRVGMDNSADPNYDSLNNAAVPDIVVTNQDDDSVGVNVSAISGNTTEAGGTATFGVTLDSQPTGNVTIALSSSDTGEGTVPVSIVKTPGNWNINTLVTITGVDDDVVDGNVDYTIVTGNVTSADANYNAITGAAVADVTVTNEDNDAVGIIVSAISGNTTEAGGTATFGVTLDSQPTGNVTIALSSSDTGEGTVPVSIVKTPGNWNINTLVTITGVDDNVVDGNVDYTIVTGNVTSTDANYNALTGAAVADVTVTNRDNDIANLSIADTAVNEDVTSGNLIFSTTLDIQVDGGFTVNYTFTEGTAIGGGTDYTGTPGTLIFTGNAGEVQDITVSIVNDQLLEQTENFTVQLGIPDNPAVILGGGGNATGSITDDDNCGFGAPLLDESIPRVY